MTTSEATATIETLREHEAAVADRSRTRIEVPAGVSFLVPPFEVSQAVAEHIAEHITDRMTAHAGETGPLVIVLSEPGWTLLTVPERGLDTPT